MTNDEKDRLMVKELKPIKFDYKFFSVLIISVLSLFVILLSIYSYKLRDLKVSENENLKEIAEELRKQNRELRDKYETFITVQEVEDYYNRYYVKELDVTSISDETIKAYVEATNDKYGQYYNAEEWAEFSKQLSGSGYGIGVLIQNKNKVLTVLDVYSDSPADKVGIQKGDILLGTDSVDFSTMEYDDILALIKGEKGTTIKLHIQRGTNDFYVEPERNEYEVNTVRLRYIEQNNKKIAYIRITNFYTNTATEFYNAITEIKEEECQGLIIDLRDNGGGTLSSVTKMLDNLLPEGPIVHINAKNEAESYTISSDAEVVLDIPMVVLVNGNTASAAELFTSSLKDYEKIQIIGTKTYGKGCGQTMYTLSNGGVVKLTSFLYDPPHSENYDGIGITPDYVVELSEQAKNTSLYLLEDADDAQLMKGLEILTKDE